MAVAHVEDVDHGYSALMKTLGSWGKPRVAVGIFAAAAAQPKRVRAGELPVTVLEVAIFNEFGTSEIPPRSFIRAWVDEARAELAQKLAAQARLVVARKITKALALERVGLWAVGQIQARIARGVPPPNSPATVARKRSSTPLVDTGQLRSSVSYKVEP